MELLSKLLPASIHHTALLSLIVHPEPPGHPLDIKEATPSPQVLPHTNLTPLPLLLPLLPPPLQFASKNLLSVETVSVLELKMPFPLQPLVALIVVVFVELSLWPSDKRINLSTSPFQFGLTQLTLPPT